MAILGTKKYWIPENNASLNQNENQILKNTGYISIQLRCVNYMSSGNFWQRTFGGKDKIVLTTNLKYQTGTKDIEVSSVQDIREVKADQNTNLGIQRNIAVKIPANSDALSIDVKMTAVKDDRLQTRFEMLNEPEYQSAMQLAPTVIGQLSTVTSMVKKLLTDSGPSSQLEASFAGLISNQKDDSPIEKGKLTQGSLVLVGTDDGEQFNNADTAKFKLNGETLFYNNKQVENTYVVFAISFESLKGEDEHSLWYKKYNSALRKLEQIYVTENQEEIKKIYRDSKKLWIEGNTLLDADLTYVQNERTKISRLVIKNIQDKYQEILKIMVPDEGEIQMDVLKNLDINPPQPETSNETSIENGVFLVDSEDINLGNFNPLDNESLNDFDIDIPENRALINADSVAYLQELKANNMRSFLDEL